MGKKKLIYGVGINDADYPIHRGTTTYINGKIKTLSYWKCPYYYSWIRILRRCFYKGQRGKYYSSYLGVSVSEDWLIFSNFRRWAEEKYFEGYQVDKDLLNYKSDIYSPETCCYIPAWLNKAIRENAAGRGDHPLGVSLIKDRVTRGYKTPFSAGAKDSFGKKNFLGYFSSSSEAHLVWQKYKCVVIKDYLEKYLKEPKIDTRVVDALNCSILNIESDIKNGIETVKIYGRTHG